MKKNLNLLFETKKSKIILKSFLVGILSSLIVIFYRTSLIYAEKFYFFINNYLANNKYYIPIWLITLVIIGFIVCKIIEIEPYSSGSGIPQIKAFMGGYLINRPVKTIIYKIIGGTLSIIGGLSLGREGPSVQLGGCTGDYLSKKFKSSPEEKHLLISSGASAGLASAFNAPLAGVIFSLEEIYKYFSPLILLSTITSAATADYISKEIFGLEPVFNFGTCPILPLKDYWLLIILGIILGISGKIYNYSIEKIQYLYSLIKLRTPYKMILPFLLSGIIGLVYPYVSCGGHSMINELTINSSLFFLISLVTIKFLFSIISFGSGAPGGIFFPLLVIGGGIGAIFAYISINFFGINSNYFYNFIILSMAGYFTAIVKAPITGIILITEMTTSFSHLLSFSIVSIIAYIVSDSLKSMPIYDFLLNNILKKNNKPYFSKENRNKIIITNVIQYNSKIENHTIKEITLPSNALIISIKRGLNSIVPKGTTLLKAGDEISILTDLKDESKIREIINNLTKEINY